MANDFFQFKKFTIRQDRCAMKVCTDSCLFGAVIADQLHRGILQAQTILDIGGGTGLLSLMAAQKCNAHIDAVEIEENACAQMNENFLASPFSERLHAYHADIKSFTEKKYDLTISNPPFFEEDLKGEDAAGSLAMHDTGLVLYELWFEIKRRLNPNGNFSILIPYRRQDFTENLIAKSGGAVTEKIFILHSERKPPFRIILKGNLGIPLPTKNSRLVISKEKHYTDEFISLLKDYYLYL